MAALEQIGFAGSSSTMITTILARLGGEYQSYVLDVLSAPLQSSVGALIYTVGAIIAVVGFITSGRFKMGLWFLIGPGLYLSAIITRTETTGPAWRFGTVDRPMERVQYETQRFLDEHGLNASGTYMPSALFVAYDALVSNLVQEIVKVLNYGRRDVDLTFLLRTELAAYLRSQEIDQSPGFRDLIHHSLLRDCHKYATAAREAQFRPQNTQAEIDRWRRRFEHSAGERVELSDVALQYLAALKTDYPTMWDAPVINDPTKRKVIDWLNNLQKTDRDPTSWRMEYQQNLAQLRQKELYSCNDIWNFVYGGLVRYAKESVDTTINRGVSAGMRREELIKDLANIAGADNRLANISGPGNVDRAYNIDGLYRLVAQTLLKNDVEKTNVFAFINDHKNRDLMGQHLKIPGQSDLTLTERERVDNEKYLERSTLVSTAATLPYYQGVALYFLSIAFPFFAILLLVPGRQGGFGMWFMLWLWVKSWDIGFAVVMMLDDVLYAIFTKNGANPANLYSRELSSQFDLAFNALQEADPTFQMGTYYAIIGTALSGIPMITSYLILGSLKGGAGMIANGVRGLSTAIAQPAQQFQGMQWEAGKMWQVDRFQRDRAGAMVDQQFAGLSPNRTWGNPLAGDQQSLGAGYKFHGTRAWKEGSGTGGSMRDPLLFGGGSAEAYTDRANQFGMMGRFLSGIADAGVDRQRPSDPNRMMPGFMDAAQQMMGGLGGGLTGVGKSRYSLLDKELDAEHKQLLYQLLYSRDVTELATFGQVRQALLLPTQPWVEAVPLKEETDAELQKMSEQLSLAQSFADIMNTAVTSGISYRDAANAQQKRLSVFGAGGLAPGGLGANMGSAVLPSLILGAGALGATEAFYKRPKKKRIRTEAPPGDEGDVTYFEGGYEEPEGEIHGSLDISPGGVRPNLSSTAFASTGHVSDTGYVGTGGDDPMVGAVAQNFHSVSPEIVPQPPAEIVAQVPTELAGLQAPVVGEPFGDHAPLIGNGTNPPLQSTDTAATQVDGSHSTEIQVAFQGYMAEQNGMQREGDGTFVAAGFSSDAAHSSSNGHSELRGMSSIFEPVGNGSGETPQLLASADTFTIGSSANMDQVGEFFSGSDPSTAFHAAAGPSLLSDSDTSRTNSDWTASAGTAFGEAPIQIAAASSGSFDFGGHGSVETVAFDAAADRRAMTGLGQAFEGDGFSSTTSEANSGFGAAEVTNGSDWTYDTGGTFGGGDEDSGTRAAAPRRSRAKASRATARRKAPAVIVHQPEQVQVAAAEETVVQASGSSGGPAMDPNDRRVPTDAAVAGPDESKQDGDTTAAPEEQVIRADENGNFPDEVRVAAEERDRAVLGERGKATSVDPTLDRYVRSVFADGVVEPVPFTKEESDAYIEAQFGGIKMASGTMSATALQNVGAEDVAIYRYTSDQKESGVVVALNWKQGDEGQLSRLVLVEDSQFRHLHAGEGGWFAHETKSAEGETVFGVVARNAVLPKMGESHDTFDQVIVAAASQGQPRVLA